MSLWALPQHVNSAFISHFPSATTKQTCQACQGYGCGMTGYFDPDCGTFFPEPDPDTDCPECGGQGYILK